MNLSFEKYNVEIYTSNSQKIRVMSEGWFLDNGYCTECLSILNKAKNNSKVCDFVCVSCVEQYELKSKLGNFGKKIADGEYHTMIRRINSNENPNLFTLNYTKERQVNNIIAIPKYFFTDKVIEKRKPLSSTAKRAGWTGCNILFTEIPDVGKIYILKDGVEIDKNTVNKSWNYSKNFIIRNLKQRSWTFEVLKIIENQKSTFSLKDIYKYESNLKILFPENKHIKAKLRQQLQILRDKKYIKFLEKGNYQKYDNITI